MTIFTADRREAGLLITPVTVRGQRLHECIIGPCTVPQICVLLPGRWGHEVNERSVGQIVTLPSWLAVALSRSVANREFLSRRPRALRVVAKQFEGEAATDRSD